MINFEKVHPDVADPHRAHPTDAGVDLTADVPNKSAHKVRVENIE